MLEHMDIWLAIDRLAAACGFSASGLAKRSGLDPTSFNPSKRTTSNGKQRWPSTESIAKVLAATGYSFAEFVALVERNATGHDGFKAQGHYPTNLQSYNVPLLGLAEAAQDTYFDETGHPTGKGWDIVTLPSLTDAGAYALEIPDDSLAPVYRAGNVLVVSPKEELRRNDRIVIKTKPGQVLVRELLRKGAQRIDVKHILPGDAEDEKYTISDIAWVARIMWVSQ